MKDRNPVEHEQLGRSNISVSNHYYEWYSLVNTSLLHSMRVPCSWQVLKLSSFMLSSMNALMIIDYCNVRWKSFFLFFKRVLTSWLTDFISKLNAIANLEISCHRAIISICTWRDGYNHKWRMIQWCAEYSIFSHYVITFMSC